MKNLIRRISEPRSSALLLSDIARRRRTGWGRIIVALCAGLIFTSTSYANETAATPVANHFKDGSRHMGFLAGYGIGFRMGSQADRDSSRELAGVRLVEFIPRIGFGMTDRLGGDHWYGGNVETLYEGALFHNTAQNGGYGIGLGTTLHYNFLFSNKIVPFIDANFGIISLNLDLERQSDGFNFNVGFGGGAHWFVSDNTAITTEIRWQHISNAKTELPNDGINAGLFLLGVSYFFAGSE